MGGCRHGAGESRPSRPYWSWPWPVVSTPARMSKRLLRPRRQQHHNPGPSRKTPMRWHACLRLPLRIPACRPRRSRPAGWSLSLLRETIWSRAPVPGFTGRSSPLWVLAACRKHRALSAVPRWIVSSGTTAGPSPSVRSRQWASRPQRGSKCRRTRTAGPRSWRTCRSGLRSSCSRSVRGELRGTSSGTTSTGTLLAEPGQYELHFVCEGTPGAELSVSTPAGVEVLAPVQVPCTGAVFKAPVLLPTEGADLTMKPGDGLEGRFAYRLVPVGQPDGKS
jgi:hypothetical protein